ncbi:1-acyl-sn-glycerol-3-phosphate acyltransferase [Marinilongibacter aquaticus]|uniref:lysophospholipid acyltransferase family protein n=1 Tax=Marinilongibacter aquaticus TaxID=2975157 RepID=UPI0021BD50EC|nr:lysophospholipid acyltransferase family protein [Marinilongibacter aquaticus]UBM59317.1 1-acyl-sn-glycerol-3-phosphate acyltransferase [Marinilongibacter aquaticus]
MLKTLRNFLPIPAQTDNKLIRLLSYLDVLGIFKTDPWGNSLFLKRLIIFVAGWPTYWRIAVANKLQIEGGEHLKSLPNTNVLFVSNHQTYFADVITFYHIFCGAKWGMFKKLYPIYLLFPRARTFYVAASETMKSGLLPKIFSLAGAILVERSWRHKGQNVQRDVDTSAGDKIKMGLDFGWVVTFPQGTTSPYAPIRKGTGHLIKSNKPIIVPVVIDGFRRAFNKTGLSYKKRNTKLKVRFKPPIYFDENATVDDIIETVKHIIEQNIPENIAEWREENESS